MRTRPDLRRSRCTSSLLALATVLAIGTTPASAQSLLGTGSIDVNGGGPAGIVNGVNTTTVTLNPGNSVINWTPNDNATLNNVPIFFQGSGTTATFQSTGDFAVLNRINSTDITRQIFMDGSINSLVNGTTGGSVYFYAPGGFILGSNSVINVGSLVLSASPISNADFTDGGSITFGQALNPNASIIVNGTAQVNALTAGSYVAMVAPRIEQYGSIAVNGSAALVAAEGAVINFSPDGLFDIQVTSGTSDANGIVNSGSIGGPASSGSGDHHRIYMVAVPKNQALTMLIQNGSNLGFDIAGAASIVDNAIVLSAGKDIVGGIPSGSPIESTRSAGGGSGNADIFMQNVDTTSGLWSDATGYNQIQSTATTTMNGDVNVHSDTLALVSTLNGNLTINGNVNVSTDRTFDVGISGTAGSSLLAADGGTLLVNGSATVSSDAIGADVNGGIAGNATGGNADIRASGGGTLQVTGSAGAYARGFGGNGVGSGATGGNGTGGNASVSIADGATSSVIVNGDLYLDSSGYGGGSLESAALAGGAGTGGLSYITVLQGTVDVDGEAYLAADGQGGSVFDGTGGTGTGGRSNIFVTQGALTIGSGDLNANLSASGQGGFAFNGIGGNAFGGRTSVDLNGSGSITIAGNLNMDGSATAGSGTTGGNATGFTSPNTNEQQTTSAIIIVRGPGGGSITIGGAANLNADARGGDGFSGEAQGNGGNALAGELDVNSQNGTVTMNGLNISATAYGGEGGVGGNGGNATAGLFDVTFGPLAQPLNGTLNLGNVSIAANAYGGAGGGGLDAISGPGGNGGNGGNAIGNTDSFNQFTANAAGGTLNAGTVSISLQTYGGTGGVGGSSNDGAGGNGGNGGNAQGGFVQTGSLSNNAINSAGGAFTMTSLSVDTSVHGGAGGNGGTGATTGGNGGNGGAAGTLTRGISLLGIRGMVATIGDVVLRSNATGGDAGFGGEGTNASGVQGNGGNAVSGPIALEARERFGVPTQRGSLILDSVYGESIATGGNGAIAGTSTAGGDNSFRLYNGDATIGSFQFVIQGDNPSSVSDYIAVVDGSATIGGTFSFETSNALALYANRTNTTLNQASLTATDIILGANTFVPFAGNSQMGSEIDPALRPGTFFADTFSITTGGDFYTTATLDSANLLEIIAPGSITVNDIVGSSAIYLNAQSGSITANNLDAVGEVDVVASTGITANDITSDAYIVASTGGQLSLNSANAATGIDLIGASGIAYATLTSGTYVNFSSGGLVQGGTIDAGTWISGYSDGDMSLGVLDSGDWIELIALGDMTLTSAIAGEYIDLATYLDNDGFVLVGGFVHTGNLTAGDSIDVRAGTNAELGNLSAGLVNTSSDQFASYTIAVLAEDYITAGNVATITHSGFASPGAITVGTVDVGGIFMVLGGGNIATGPIDAGTNTYFGNYSMMALGGSITNSFDPAPILASVPVATGGNIAIGGAVNTGDFRAAAGGAFTATTIDASGQIEIRSIGSTTTGALDAGTSLLIQANVGPIAIDTASAGTSLSLRSTGNIAASDLTAGTAILLGSDGQVAVGNMTSGGTIDARSVGAATYGNIAAADGLYVGAIGALTFGNMIAGETARFGSDTSVNGGNVTAGDSVIGTSGGGVTLGNLSAGIIDQSVAPGALYEAVIFGFGAVSVGDISALGEVQLAGQTGITGGNVTTDSRMFAVSDGSIALGNLDVGGTVLIGGFSMFDYTGNLRTDFDASPTFASAPVAAGGSFTAGAVATDSLNIAANGNITLGDLTIDGPILLDSGGNLTLGNVRSVLSSISLLADGNITAGALTAYGRILVRGAGSVVVGNVTSGVIPPNFANSVFNIGPGVPVEIFGANIASGDIVATGYVGLYTPGTLSTGTIVAAHDVVALAGGNASFGAITTPETFTLAGYGNFAALNPPSGFDPSLILGLDTLSATNGNAVFAGSSSAEYFRTFVGGNTTVQSISGVFFVDLDTGGLMSVNGSLQSDYVALTSGDIAIGANAVIAANGVSLLSTSATGTFVGDNLTGTGGYRISQAEFDRIQSPSLEFEVQTDRGALGELTIGDLTLDFTDVENGSEVLEFSVTDNGQTENPVGIIRIVGTVDLRVLSDHQVDFEAETIAINAETGSLSLTDGAGDLSGLLTFYAPNVFVASAAILDRLLVDPRYSGYVDELNAPATVQRPDGVLRAAAIEFGDDVVLLENLLVQNTGTRETPAGFVVTATDIGDADGGDVQLAPGSINLVINGQVVTETGTLTGIAVRDLLVAEFGAEPFVQGSTINGCLLDGGCGGGDSLPPAAVVTPTQIDLLTNDPLGETDFGNEPDIDDNVDGDGETAGSPIDAPQPLFDTRPLIDTSLVDDPVSGAGNPSLYGSSDEDDDDEDEEDGKDKGKQDEKGDGQ